LENLLIDNTSGILRYMKYSNLKPLKCLNHVVVLLL
jgi:hypothetical protein